jgi:hypothetical protein
VGTRQCTTNSDEPMMAAISGIEVLELALTLRAMPLRMM